MYAVVAVNAPVHGAGTVYPAPGVTEQALYPGPVFHYGVPDALRDRVHPGVLLEVPFGPRRVQGIVVALSEHAPVDDIRPVARRCLDEPLLDARQIGLGLWLSTRYCAPLIDCLRLMLPPGVLRRPRSILQLHPEVTIPGDLSRSQQAVVDLLQHSGPLSAQQVARQLGRDRSQR